MAGLERLPAAVPRGDALPGGQGGDRANGRGGVPATDHADVCLQRWGAMPPNIAARADPRRVRQERQSQRSISLSFFETLLGIRTWQTSEQVVITDVTRMQGDKVCIAALDQGKPIRLYEPSPNELWLRSIDGLRPGDAVSITWKSPRRCRRPHVEDSDWNPSSFIKTDPLADGDFVQHLSAGAFPSVRKAFGQPCFHSQGGNTAFKPDKGSRSLASVAAGPVRVYPHEEAIRVDFTDEADEWKMVPLEDLAVRMHQTHCQPCSSDLPGWLASEFEGARAILRVGLGRPFKAKDLSPACWLQVNHVFLMPSKRKHFV